MKEKKSGVNKIFFNAGNSLCSWGVKPGCSSAVGVSRGGGDQPVTES